LEANSLPGKINISEATFHLIKHEFDCEHRGKLEVKNMGEVEMYFVK
jgi:adenylate cyclase